MLSIGNDNPKHGAHLGRGEHRTRIAGRSRRACGLRRHRAQGQCQSYLQSQGATCGNDGHLRIPRVDVNALYPCS